MRTVPSSIFNHAILAIEWPAGINSDSYKSVLDQQNRQAVSHLCIQPTNSLHSVLCASTRGICNALRVTESGGEFIYTPLLSPDTNLLSRTGHFTHISKASLAAR